MPTNKNCHDQKRGTNGTLPYIICPYDTVAPRLVTIRGHGDRRVPLRLFTRRKEVAWLWAGEQMELIGGGVPDGAGDTTF